MKPKINEERLGADFNTLSEIGATIDGGVSRIALSNEDLEARGWLADRFEDAGLIVRDDDAGNLSGLYLSQNPDAKTLLIGSHLDSVPHGGRYDGAVGILGGLECVRSIREANLTLPFHVEVIDFTDQEGVWQSLFGSRALAGMLPHEVNIDRDGDFGPFRAALFRAGIHPSDIYKAKRNPSDLLGYLELHIEQSYLLDEADLDIGIVTSIVGRSTYRITFLGEASHSGTTKISARRDALLGASAFITLFHRVMRSEFPYGMVNVGNVTVEPGAFNTIPAQADVTAECRHADKVMLNAMEQAMLDLARTVAAEHALHLEIKRTAHMPAAAMSEMMMKMVDQACGVRKARTMELTSFAGHDAQIMSLFTPSAMIFIPSVDGISHSPKEFTRWPHVVQGVDVLLETILQLAAHVRGDTQTPS